MIHDDDNNSSNKRSGGTVNETQEIIEFEDNIVSVETVPDVDLLEDDTGNNIKEEEVKPTSYPVGCSTVPSSSSPNHIAIDITLSPAESIRQQQRHNDAKTTQSSSNINNPDQAQKQEQFSIGLFSIGSPQHCLFSYCCTPYALAFSRSKLDNSWFCFNLLCVNVFTTRFLVRSAYNIPDTMSNDLLFSCCCIPCVTNQILQTVMIQGKREPSRMFVRTALDADCSQDFTCDQLAASLCCFPCITAMASSNALRDLPFPIALCCISPCTNANIVRYHYGDTSDEWSCLDDCVGLTCMYPLTWLMCLIPCYWRFYGKCVVDIGHNGLNQVDRATTNKAYLHPI